MQIPPMYKVYRSKKEARGGAKVFHPWLLVFLEWFSYECSFNIRAQNGLNSKGYDFVGLTRDLAQGGSNTLLK